MADNYSQAVLKVVIAQICKNAGWDSINSRALDVLVDFAERYMSQIGRKSRRYSEQFGRTDPCLNELEIVFREMGIDAKELLDFTKSAEPISLGHQVAEFPAEPLNRVDLLIPELDEDNKVSVPKVTFADEAINATGSSSTNTMESPSAGSRQPTVSPARPTVTKSSRAGDVRENTRFKVRSQLMIEDGEISSLFSSGKAPTAKRPPRPLHESNIPKLKVEPISKPRINTGVLKPKPKPKSPPPVEIEETVEVDVPTIVTPPSPKPVSERPKHKPPKKVDKKKKKKPSAVAQPEGFTDIFGATLEKPQSKSKPKLEKRLSVSLEDIAKDRPASAASGTSGASAAAPLYMDDMTDNELRSITPDSPPPVSANKPAVKARLKRYGSTIDSVVASNKSEVKKDEAAHDAFSFDDRPVPPMTPTKSSLKSPKKSKSPARSRSPVDRSMKSPDPSSSPKPSKKKDKDKSHKKGTNKRRLKMLEKFAADKSAGLRQATPPPRSPPEPPPVVEPVPEVVSEPVKAAVVEDDDEEIEVNVDEDSDVDILVASSPTPPPQNPYSAYAESEYGMSAAPLTAPTTSFVSQDTTYAEPMDYGQNTGLGDVEGWQGYAPDPTPTVDYNSSSKMIDFGQSEPTLEVPKKEKHKKEKKEKKEKKKKKHKEKDKERKHEDGSRHRHHSNKVSPQGGDESSQDTVPKLTLRIGSQPFHDSYDDDASHMDTSYGTEVEPPAETVPKLVIKPADAGYSSYPESASFAPQAAFPATTDYASTSYTSEPVAVPDADGRIWICPACGKPDDGSPMIGCDGCDEWYHWPCVGIFDQPPDDVEWFCQLCAEKDKKKKKKRKKDKR